MNETFLCVGCGLVKKVELLGKTTTSGRKLCKHCWETMYIRSRSPEKPNKKLTKRQINYLSSIR